MRMQYVLKPLALSVLTAGLLFAGTPAVQAAPDGDAPQNNQQRGNDNGQHYDRKDKQERRAEKRDERREERRVEKRDERRDERRMEKRDERREERRVEKRDERRDERRDQRMERKHDNRSEQGERMGKPQYDKDRRPPRDAQQRAPQGGHPANNDDDVRN